MNESLLKLFLWQNRNHVYRVRFSVGIVVLLFSTIATGQDPAAQRLVITEKNGVYELVVAVSRLITTIPKGQLTPSNPDAGSHGTRYFSFEDRKTALVVSGWVEPEQAFNGMDAFWAGEQRSLSQNGIQIQDTVMEQIGNWHSVLYDIGLRGGRSSNMRAELVRAGTWIDIHISVTTDRPEAENRKILRDTLETIHVDERVP